MTGFDQIKRGVVAYIDKELLPIAPKPLKIALAAFGPTIVEAKLREFVSSGFFSGTNLMSDDGIDVDAVVQLLKPASAGEWPIPMYGFTFTEADLDKLYRYIKEA